jgi:hypothetical protein
LRGDRYLTVTVNRTDDVFVCQVKGLSN